MGADLSEAIGAAPNNTVRFAEVPSLGVTVQRGMTHDGLGHYLSQVINKAPGTTADIAGILRLSESAVSHQMRELRLMKLVTAENRGRMVYYRLADTHIRHILEDTLRHVQEDGDRV